MEKWKSWAIGIASTWVLLAFIAWQAESDCGVFFSRACFSESLSVARWIILLKWISPYQTLIAGLAAVAGGGFVLWSQVLQIRENRTIAAEKRIDDFKSALAITRAEIIHISDHLYKETLYTENANLNHTRSNLQTIASFDPRLLHITMSVLNRLDKALQEKAKGDASSFSSVKFAWFSSVGLCFADLLRQVQYRLEKGAPLQVEHGSFDGTQVYEFLLNRLQHPDILFELGPYFVWPNGNRI
ncbi:hypothetical protein J3U99_10915 [Brucella pituitosa]|uniref:hypothetical protein n=1 Tax=Brucella pituitosa TaxID=571256 RepID=UPI002005E93F|nr:hypothetical protein [Brucella pituitosa]MCK4205278.1 hypothetical protein [Brucella pituitosa]